MHHAHPAPCRRAPTSHSTAHAAPHTLHPVPCTLHAAPGTPHPVWGRQGAEAAGGTLLPLLTDQAVGPSRRNEPDQNRQRVHPSQMDLSRTDNGSQPDRPDQGGQCVPTGRQPCPAQPSPAQAALWGRVRPARWEQPRRRQRKPISSVNTERGSTGTGRAGTGIRWERVAPQRCPVLRWVPALRVLPCTVLHRCPGTPGSAPGPAAAAAVTSPLSPGICFSSCPSSATSGAISSFDFPPPGPGAPL